MQQNRVAVDIASVAAKHAPLRMWSSEYFRIQFAIKLGDRFLRKIIEQESSDRICQDFTPEEPSAGNRK
jgi:hypothetical protein